MREQNNLRSQQSRHEIQSLPFFQQRIYESLPGMLEPHQSRRNDSWCPLVWERKGYLHHRPSRSRADLRGKSNAGYSTWRKCRGWCMRCLASTLMLLLVPCLCSTFRIPDTSIAYNGWMVMRSLATGTPTRRIDHPLYIRFADFGILKNTGDSGKIHRR